MLKRTAPSATVTVAGTAMMVKQPKIDNHVVPVGSTTMVTVPLNLTQSNLDANVCNYIIQDIPPLSTVESPAFQRLIAPMLLGSKKPLKLISRRTVNRRISTTFNLMIDNIIDSLSKTKYKCLTADIWSANHKSYLGVTSHWINDDYSRGSAALACRRMIGTHDYSAIASALHEVMLKFRLRFEEVTNVITDNASNFAKAFRE